MYFSIDMKTLFAVQLRENEFPQFMYSFKVTQVEEISEIDLE